ncbi:isocitrate lyase/PEP mutase family protein [Streptomyces zagrosensis]|uniref:2-methylisocitrate lyase-like PEP mutase family enzyme n=1 Tax=Streptomyces zagrosensis TaxID=1042984 RepID=A0A7W9Q8S5_9ACTN|nr:isocitrate lyase/phosphoenolpyruvate mutase family protein [Streptomyces zagrosensis]MBB5934782.1 2-methylisocitrate lyase-like PEP mutase family enzyme [Streptomyces zagrosensis]
MSSANTAEAFLAMHQGRAPGDPLILPGPWDAASARIFADVGFPALATPSAGIAASLGYEDGGGTPVDEMFAAITRICRVVDIPVSADIEDGYGLAPAELVERLLESGVVGCNLEDTDLATGQLKDPQQQADWLAQVRQEAGKRLVINARVDTFLRGETTTDGAIKRAKLYIGAGADVIYPLLAPTELVTELAQGIDAPLNVAFMPGGPAPAQLGELGVARVTFGPGMFHEAMESLRALSERVRSAQPRT